MDTDKYKALLSAIETGSLSAAAAELDYTPSGVSRAVASLEESLGFSLLVRKKSGVLPTEECQLLLPLFRNLIHTQDQIDQTAARICGLETGSVTIGTAYSPYYPVLSRCIMEFQALHPGISVRLIEETSSHLCNLLQEQTLDFCIVSRRDGIDTFIPLCEDTICIWVPHSHPAVQKGIYPLRELANENYISIHPNMETDNSRLLAKHHITPRICASTSDVPAAWTMVAAGMGVTLINRILSRQWDGPVVTLPLDTSPAFEIGIAAPVREMQSPAAAELMEFMRKDLILAFEATPQAAIKDSVSVLPENI